MEKKEKKEHYIIKAMKEIHKNGDAYTDLHTLHSRCSKRINFEDFQSDVLKLLREKELFAENGRVSLYCVAASERTAANALADIIPANRTAPLCAIPPDRVNDIILTEEQRNAILLASSARLSLILGGAGTGKSTMISGLMRAYGKDDDSVVLAAPTGKAAQTLRMKTNHYACTLHSLLGLGLEGPVILENHLANAKLVVLDEAGMLTTEMLAGVLSRVSEDCHVVLVGDPNQLQSVGAGNVLPDLLALNLPSITLRSCHRQKNTLSALAWNVDNFSKLRSASALRRDDSFEFWEAPERNLRDSVCGEAARRYLEGEDFQLLSVFRKSGCVCTNALNTALQPVVNPGYDRREYLDLETMKLYDGDRILVTQNCGALACHNGDGGILQMSPEENSFALAALKLDDGRTVYIHFVEQALNLQLQLGYATTVHKAQGSEFNSILLPLSTWNSNMLNRNLLYTAISRARRKVILIGSPVMLDRAMKTSPRKRKSSLVEHTLSKINASHCAA